MATLNGVEFQILTIEWATYQNNVVQEVIGGDTVVVHSQGYKTDPVKIQGRIRRKEEFDDFQEEFYSGEILTFIKEPSSGKQYQVYALGNVRLEEGSNNESEIGIIFNCLIQLKSPYKESTLLISRSKTITTNNQEWSAEDRPFDNPINNWSLEDWSDGVSGVNPDGWTTTRAAANYPARESTHIKTGTYSAAMKWNGVGSNSIFRQTLVGFDASNSAGKTVTFGMWVKANAATKTFIQIYDGTTAYNSSYNSGADWEFLEVSCTIDSSATSILLTVDVRDDTNEVYIDSAIYIIDSSIPYSSFSKNISTDGNVNAVPDIRVTGNKEHIFSVDIQYNSTSPAGLTWDGNNIWSTDTTNNKINKHNTDMSIHTQYNSPSTGPKGLAWDGSNIWSCDSVTNKIYKHNADMSINTTYNAPSTGISGLTWDGNNIWSCDGDSEKIYKHNADITVNTTYDSPSSWPSGLTWDGSNIWSCDVNSDSIYKYNPDMTVNTTYSSPSTIPFGLTWDNITIWSCDLDGDKIYKQQFESQKNINVNIYNIGDTTVKSGIGNNILYTAIHRINIDGTGTINYNDYFTTDRWRADSINSGITEDLTNDKLDIADDGYIYWKKDTKFPINGIPILTSKIDITSGIPTIQISIDASTWYDIDTAIVDDVETIYPLDSDGNLSLVGKTLFYFRIDCVKVAAATCSIKYFELDINTHTIYAKNPKITKGSSPSTFRIDQDSDSGMACIVDLIYQDKWWI